MKIGVNSRIYQNANTGIPYYIERLYKKLVEKDTSNQYVFFQTQIHKTIGNTKTLRVPFGLAGDVLFDTLSVNKLIQSERVDIFHGPSHILPFQKQPGVKYVVTIHDLSFITLPQTHSRLFNAYYRFMVGDSLKRADAITADSENTKQDIIKYYNIPSDKIDVVYLAVDEYYFHQEELPRLINAPYFFSLTTNPKRKNILRVLEIFATLPSLKEYTYVIAGWIPESQRIELEEKISSLGLQERVTIYGYVSESHLKSLYTHAQFFIYPSYYEGFGFPVVEAMVCQCPVIASGVSSLKELLPTDEWLIDPYSNEEIADKINLLLQLSSGGRTQLIETNHAYASRFQWSKTADKMIEIFRR